MRLKIDTKRLINISYNVVITGIMTEVVNETIKATKNKIKNIKRKKDETR